MDSPDIENTFIDGKRVYIQPIKRTDLESYICRWSNDAVVTKYMFTGVFPCTTHQLESEFERVQASNNDYWFTIVLKENNKVIGHTGIYSINWVARSAEYRILIGDKSSWSKGYGAEVTQLLVGYCFERLNLNKVWLGVNSDNQAAINMYKNSGFVCEGTLRSEIYRNGKYYDADRMSILRDEFYNKKEYEI